VAHYNCYQSEIQPRKRFPKLAKILVLFIKINFNQNFFPINKNTVVLKLALLASHMATTWFENLRNVTPNTRSTWPCLTCVTCRILSLLNVLNGVLCYIRLCKWVCQWMEYALIPPKQDSFAQFSAKHEQSAMEANLPQQALRETYLEEYVTYFAVCSTISWTWQKYLSQAYRRCHSNHIRQTNKQFDVKIE